MKGIVPAALHPHQPAARQGGMHGLCAIGQAGPAAGAGQIAVAVGPHVAGTIDADALAAAFAAVDAGVGLGADLIDAGARAKAVVVFAAVAAAAFDAEGSVGIGERAGGVVDAAGGAGPGLADVAFRALGVARAGRGGGGLRAGS